MTYGFLGSVALVLIRLFVGGLLVTAGLLKLKAGTRWFQQQILAYKIVKGQFAWLLARFLPMVELICGLLLLLGWQTPTVSLISFGLLWLFSAAIIYTIWQGRQVGCGCFGQRTSTVSLRGQWTMIYRNLILMGLLIVVYSFASNWSLDTWLNRQLLLLYPTVGIQVALTIWWTLSLLAALFGRYAAQQQINGKPQTEPSTL